MIQKNEPLPKLVPLITHELFSVRLICVLCPTESGDPVVKQLFSQHQLLRKVIFTKGPLCEGSRKSNDIFRARLTNERIKKRFEFFVHSSMYSRFRKWQRRVGGCLPSP